jgi:Arc/MetJ-type ribon-helix-helix transcriptional regulator
MKQKLSISVEENVIALLDRMMEDGRFRNKSHIVEFAINKLVEENENE